MSTGHHHLAGKALADRQSGAQTDTSTDSITIQGVTISKPSKLLYPDDKVSKGDVATYYAAVAQRILPHLQGRLMSTFRCPNGIDGDCFFKRHEESAANGLGIKSTHGRRGQLEEYVFVKDTQGLLSEVQQYTLEFHPWGSQIDNLEPPDLMVFDLDPDVGIGLERIRRGVTDLKQALDELALTAFLKTSGGKGYHVVIPLQPSAKIGWSEFQAFAKSLSQRLEAQWPDRYTSVARKDYRQGRIYIDWERNVRSATTVAPYSLRARQGATVSMPITWEELNEIAPDGVGLEAALHRLNQPDPWEGFFAIRQELP